MKKTVWIIIIILIIIFGILVGVRIFKNKNDVNNAIINNNIIKQEENIEISLVETSADEKERTTPNTLIIYKTYYTKCKHYIQKYEDIDASLVNCTEDELKEKCKGWRIDKFSSKEVEMSKEEEKFCNEHYKLKLENSAIVIYNVDENGVETEYEQTGITTEYLTEEDILKLTIGIYVYGKENLTSTIEDYE